MTAGETTGMKFSVPASIGEITKEWLRVVLESSHPEATFHNLKGQRIGEEFGFASDIFRYQWEDKGKHLSVIVKMWNTDSKAGIGEVLFYQTFWDIGTRIPACFYSEIDSASQKAVLVLEDINDGVTQGDVLEELTLEQAKGVAHNLAILHGDWLDHPRLQKLNWIPQTRIWNREINWFVDRRSLFLKRFPNRLDGLAQVLLNKLELAPEVTNERLSNAPMTLLHGDFHLDNIIFERHIEPVFVDWSRPLIGPLTVNLASLLFGMVEMEQYDEIFDYYLDSFNKVAKNPMDKPVVEKQLGGELLRKFSLATCGIAKWNPTLPRAIEMIEAGIEHMNGLISIWHERDPELFSFLH